MSWKNIRAKINRCNSDDLLHLVKQLYALNQENKNFLHARFLDDKETIERYKQQIAKGLLFEPYEEKPKLGMARKAVTDFKKASGDVVTLMELMLYYLNCGKEMAIRYGYYENGYAGSMTSMFKNAMKLFMENPGQLGQYHQQLVDLANRFDQVGWEFEQYL